MAFQPGVIDELDLWLIKGTEHSNSPTVFSGIINFRFQWRSDWFKKGALEKKKALRLRVKDLQKVHDSTTTSAPAQGVLRSNRNLWVKRFMLVLVSLLDARLLGSQEVLQWMEEVLKNTPGAWHDNSWPSNIAQYVMDEVTQKRESLKERQSKPVIPQDQKAFLNEIAIYLKYRERSNMDLTPIHSHKPLTQPN
ncbi:hypothetical protein PG990_001606 [Apiospora arundinis]|uniref:Uncharacterized protein n=1 Tax=Apiospora arundinis TaxID=335852 RepID=A0ABR2HS50_9PEZI